MMKKKALSDNETLFRLDCRMALHQRLCWLILACLAAVGVWLMTEVQNSALSDTVRTALLFAVMMGLVMAYRWSSAAPVRSLRKWSRRLEAGNAEQYRELLNYVLEHGLDGLTEADIHAMLRFANTAAYIVTTKKGAIRSMPERSQVEKLLGMQ